MPETLRVGIIGTGRAGWQHAAAFSRLPKVHVTGLWNRTRSRADELAATLKNKFDVRVYDHWRDLVENAEIDIISIATHPSLREEPFAAAISRQLHVLVEKPLSVGLPEAQKIATLAQQSNTVTAISLNWRYSPASQTAWRAIQEGQIGRIMDARTEWRIRSNPQVKPFSEVGGILREVGTHEFDRIRFLTGWEFKRVACLLKSTSISESGKRDTIQKPSDSSAIIMAEMSCQGQGSFKLISTPGEPERNISLCGEKGTLVLSSEWVTVPQSENKNVMLTLSNDIRVSRQLVGDAHPIEMKIAESDVQPSSVVSGQHTWNRLIADFVNAVYARDLTHESVPHLPHISDGLAAQQVIRACELSHYEERWVNV